MPRAACSRPLTPSSTNVHSPPEFRFATRTSCRSSACGRPIAFERACCSGPFRLSCYAHSSITSAARRAAASGLGGRSSTNAPSIDSTWSSWRARSASARDIGAPAMSQTSAAPPASWPAAVFRAPVLRGLDGRGRTELTRYGRVIELAPGAVLFEPGQPSDSLFVVAQGVLELRAVARGDAAESVLREIGRYGMLGEEAVVPGLKRAARAVCKSAAKVCEIPLTVLSRALAR